MNPNSDEYWTKEAILQRLLAPRPKPVPKAAVERAADRWAQKSTKAVIADEAAHNEAVIARLKAEAEAEDFKRSEYQRLIDRVWQNQLDYQASLRELPGRPSYHVGPSDPDWSWRR
jgi:preprotein translocase subunit SecA